MPTEIQLWAKSASNGRDGHPTSVATHCRDVRDAAQALWEAIEADLSSTLRISQGVLESELKTLLLLAAQLHDIGKANSAFQAMVKSPTTQEKQPVRHEVLSAICIARPELLGDWLAHALDPEQRSILLWAVAGHHLKIRRRNGCDIEDPLFRTANTPKEVVLYLNHNQIGMILDEVLDLLPGLRSNAVERPVLTEETLSAFEDDKNGLHDWVRGLVPKPKDVRQPLGDKAYRLRLALLKALLISSDVAGSALIADGRAPGDWISEKLSARVSPETLEPVIAANLEGRKEHDFQKRVANSDKPATVVMAGCGNGKTTAAYMWAQKWAAGRKLFFCYPTTGTASAGFEDYLLAQNQLTRDLIHGRAWVDLRAMRDCPDDAATETANRLESLSAWGCQVVACTVDTVLGLIQNQSRPLFSFPAIACGAFVFDEIHSYDRRLFEELLIFLRMFPGAPVLLMSASIPPDRLAAIRDVLGDRMGDIITGDDALERIERYTIQMRPSAKDCWADVEAALKLGHENNNKVLWVCNTVGDAQRIWNEARSRGIRWKQDSPILYHSRLRYKNRVERQDQVLAAFDGPGRCLAITTQVCEMSLDISANLLVTALAPLPSLVQRLGRLNRRATRDDAWPCLVYPFEGKPYDCKESLRQMAAARTMVHEMGGKGYRQSDLAAYLKSMGVAEDEHAAREKKKPLHSAWLDGGWESEPLPAREGESSVTIILEDDLPEIRKKPGMGDPKKWNARNLVPWTIPILARGFRGDGRRAGPYPIAPSGSVMYDETEGVR